MKTYEQAIEKLTERVKDINFANTMAAVAIEKEDEDEASEWKREERELRAMFAEAVNMVSFVYGKSSWEVYKHIRGLGYQC